MAEMHTTLVVQQYLDKLGQIEGGAPAEPIIRALLDRAVRRLELLCRKFLHGSYPRLAKPPVNLEADELLSAVVERLLKAMREARPDWASVAARRTTPREATDEDRNHHRLP